MSDLYIQEVNYIFEAWDDKVYHYQLPTQKQPSDKDNIDILILGQKVLELVQDYVKDLQKNVLYTLYELKVGGSQFVHKDADYTEITNRLTSRHLVYGTVIENPKDTFKIALYSVPNASSSPNPQIFEPWAKTPIQAQVIFRPGMPVHSKLKFEKIINQSDFFIDKRGIGKDYITGFFFSYNKYNDPKGVIKIVEHFYKNSPLKITDRRTIARYERRKGKRCQSNPHRKFCNLSTANDTLQIKSNEIWEYLSEPEENFGDDDIVLMSTAKTGRNKVTKTDKDGIKIVKEVEFLNISPL